MKLSLLREGDWPGIITMAIGLSALQTVLEEGNKDDWFGSPFIVRLSVIAAVALSLFLVDRTDQQQAAAQSAPAVPPQFRLRHPGQLPARRRAVRLGLHPAGLSVAHPGLQFRADRHGAGLDRTAATGADPAGAAADEALRPAPRDRRRLRAVRRLQLHEHLHDDGLRHRPAVLAQRRSRHRPGAGVRAALGGRNRRHRAGECRFRVGAVQHDAQPRRRRRHRRAADAA